VDTVQQEDVMVVIIILVAAVIGIAILFLFYAGRKKPVEHRTFAPTETREHRGTGLN
jgi:hypothetical protein